MRFQKIILHKKNRSGFRKSDESERFFAFCLAGYTPYSPDLNPIEKMWSKLKAFLRKEKIRIASELPSAISKGFLTIRTKDCIGWFHSCDYVQ